MSDPRLFLAVPIPEGLKRSLLELQAALASPLWDLSLTDPGDFHLTLHYLGSTPSRVMDDLKRELGAVAHARRPFDLRCQGLGAFPDAEEPRVLWAAVQDPHARLAELFEASRKVLNAYRLFKLRDDLQAHLTLARVRSLSAAWSPDPLRALASESLEPQRLPVERLQLMRSRGPEEAGPRYELLADLALQA